MNSEEAERSKVNVRLLVAYDGTNFHGLAPNTGVRTVVGELQRVIEPLIGEIPDIVMSGRTDSGVHAWGQVLSFTMADGAVELDRIQKSVNSRLGPEVVIREIGQAAESFNARFSATGRRYHYLIINRPVNDPFLAPTGWWVAAPLDVTAMNDACRHLIGEHDFSSFCRQPKGPEPGPVALIRRVDAACWLELGEGLLRFEIAGSAFCHQMVRSIVGFMVAVGSGKRQADDLPEVIDAHNRSAAENPAPPHGLTLWQVDY